MNEQQAFKGPESNQLNQIIQKFLPYWPLFIISVALCLAIAYIKLRAEQPVYVAYAKLLLKDKKKGTESKVLDEFDLAGEAKVVENEILVLRSSGLLQEVVRRLNLSATVYNEGRVRVEELYKENSPIDFIPLHRDSIFDGGTYYFKVDWSKGEIDIDNRKVQFNSVLNIGSTDYKVVPNLKYNKSVGGKNYFVVFSSVQGAAGGLSGSISASPMSSTSSVIDVSISTFVPERGRDVLTELFKVYNEFAVADKQQSSLNTLNFIEGRLATVALQLDSIEQGVVDFRTTQAPIDLEVQASTYFEQMNQFTQQKTEIDLKLASLRSVRGYLANGGSVPSLGQATDPNLSALITQLQGEQLKLQEYSATDGPNSDRVISAKEKISSTRRDILENINNLERSLSSTRGSYGNLAGQRTSALKRNPQMEKAFATISRQQGVKNTIYNYLLEKREETQLASAATIADLRVLETANAYGPVSPVPKSFYSKWLMIGLIVPTAFVLLKDLLNRKVQFRNEIDQKTSIPIVAEISQVNSDSPIVIREGKRTASAEQFRSLRTNLTFMGLTEKTNTIMITSSTSGEGKSFVAINLAISFTLIGKKVALMELDLRKPKVSKLLQLNNDIGISNYLVNQATITDIIKPTEIKNLFVFSSGIIPPNPAELIQKDKFRQLMDEVKERFDYVIIDTAPVGPVSDSFLLKEYADATVYITRQNKTPRMYLPMLEELRRKERFKNLCLVFNGVKKRGLVYGTYGNGTYGDGNGYYVNDEKEGSITLLSKRIKRTFGIKN